MSNSTNPVLALATRAYDLLVWLGVIIQSTCFLL